MVLTPEGKSALELAHGQRGQAAGANEEALMPWIAISGTDEKEIREALDELEHASPRAAAILGAVFVDESLATLLKSKLKQDMKLLGDMFGRSKPLGGFGPKINLGFLMGLYSEVARTELDIIRKIRNEFAHKVARSFETPLIRGWTTDLSLGERVPFHLIQADGKSGLFMGSDAFPEGTTSSTPVLLPTDKPADPRERYMRACHFYNAALLFLIHSPTVPVF
jgi:hypothetical protein